MVAAIVVVVVVVVVVLAGLHLGDIDIVVDTNPYNFTDHLAQIFGGTPVVLDESRSNICRLSGIEKLPNQQRNFSEKIDKILENYVFLTKFNGCAPAR